MRKQLAKLVGMPAIVTMTVAFAGAVSGPANADLIRDIKKGAQNLGEEAGKGIQNLGKEAEKGVQNLGKEAEKGVQNFGKAAEKAAHDSGKTIEKAVQDTGKAGETVYEVSVRSKASAPRLAMQTSA